ncbi:MAG TPA: ribose-phosphate pyrophosphokinase [Parvularculaceae bacterium]|nr:ribose-phosphate pyrophosphokinase [Parvularculaceae bacterium]
MSDVIIIPMPGNEAMARALAAELNIAVGSLLVRRFPDGESYVRLETPVGRRRIILVCTLDRPDQKFLPLIFAAGAARELGASGVGLVAPYLAYMRQDRRFQSGEAVTSTHFAAALNPWVDWLVTVDPHLHRRTSLSEIYAIPSVVQHAAPAISGWIRDNVDNPVLVGPDSESEQWVAAVAKDAGAPFAVLEKVRKGDRDVEISAPQVEEWGGRTPVLVDDIISTARTMMETVGLLKNAGLPPPVCIGVHAVFADNAYQELRTAGAGRVITCNTIEHESNEIELGKLIANGVRTMLK